MSDADFRDLENHACPGAGACGGQFTANTMALALEFLGLSPMGSASPPALDARKGDAAYKAGTLVVDQLRRGLTPRTILTRLAFENAIAGVAATGGFDQRRAAPPGDRPRGRRPPDASTTSTPSAPGRRPLPTSSPAAGSSPPTWTRPAGRRWWPIA